MSADTAVAVCEYVVKQLVDNPDAVSVARSETDGGLRLDVTVGDGDMGRVIGKRGRVAGAIRTVVRAAGVDDEVTSIEVEFVD
ncbi:MAG: KH domain-containing protein [Acidimicrobiales bacterium]